MNVLVSLIVWIFCGIFALALFMVSLVIWFVTLPFDREKVVMHWWLVAQGIFFSRMIPLWRIRVEGREKAEKGETYVIISNHQSMLDILILNCIKLRFRWISKIENYKAPVIGWYLRMAKYITVDRGNKESKAVMMAKSEESLKKGISIMMFPEGTRSPDMEIGPFKLGAFQLALSANKPILPVIIEGTGGVLPKHGMIFSTGNLLKIKVLDPVRPESFGTDDPEILAAKLRDIMADELHKIRNA